ncbi:MAG TPA: DUF1028 domain-containing protein [Solirubrobacterales bacterium]|jgi:uncharacterized Ntn-hydrolase superfamily protein
MRRGTYSIVARDADSGQLGVAVQSHWFSVGSVVSWAEPGVGAVATQSVAEPAYGPRLLELLRGGDSPSTALQGLLDADDQARFRQVAVVDSAGRVAVHTGEGCIPFAGDAKGEGFSAQANMMASSRVWRAMAETFSSSDGPLARRLLAALRAAEDEGGDVRGRQSAALVVVEPEGEPWERAVELRVEDDPEPLDQLARLVDLREAYSLANEADKLGASGRHEEAGERFVRASQLSPDNPELLFWGGVGVAQTGNVELGAQLVGRAIELNPGWRELLVRLEPEIAPGAEPVRKALGIEGTKA